MVIESWARLMWIDDLHPLEVEALLQITDAMMVANAPKQEGEPAAPEDVKLQAQRRPSWPRRK